MTPSINWKNVKQLIFLSGPYMETIPIGTPLDLINMQTISGKSLQNFFTLLSWTDALYVTFVICPTMWCILWPHKCNDFISNKTEIRWFYQVMLLWPPFCQSPFSSSDRLRERCTLGNFGVSTWFSTNRLRRVPVTWQVVVVSAVVRMFSLDGLPCPKIALFSRWSSVFWTGCPKCDQHSNWFHQRFCPHTIKSWFSIDSRIWGGNCSHFEITYLTCLHPLLPVCFSFSAFWKFPVAICHVTFLNCVTLTNLAKL